MDSDSNLDSIWMFHNKIFPNDCVGQSTIRVRLRAENCRRNSYNTYNNCIFLLQYWLVPQQGCVHSYWDRKGNETESESVVMPVINFPYKRPFYNLTLTPQEINVRIIVWNWAGLVTMCLFWHLGGLRVVCGVGPFGSSLFPASLWEWGTREMGSGDAGGDVASMFEFTCMVWIHTGGYLSCNESHKEEEEDVTNTEWVVIWYWWLISLQWSRRATCLFVVVVLILSAAIVLGRMPWGEDWIICMT